MYCRRFVKQSRGFLSVTRTTIIPSTHRIQDPFAIYDLFQTDLLLLSHLYFKCLRYFPQLNSALKAFSRLWVSWYTIYKWTLFDALNYCLSKECKIDWSTGWLQQVTNALVVYYSVRSIIDEYEVNNDCSTEFMGVVLLLYYASCSFLERVVNIWIPTITGDVVKFSFGQN